MKLKKIIFSVFCAAIMLCTGVVCLASANNGGVSTCATKNYSEYESYNGVSLSVRGVSAAPASLSQIVNPSSTKKTYFGEVYVARSGNGAVVEDGDNKAIASGKTVTGSVEQKRDGRKYLYEHYVALHASTTASTPIVKSLDKSYYF